MKPAGEEPLIRKKDTFQPILTGTHIPILRFSNLERTGLVSHGFTTRDGGVSGGIWRSLNLSFSRGDDPAAVRENFRRTAEEIGFPEERFVFTDQTHTVNVRVVGEEDAGKGLVRPRGYTDVDGLVTDVPGLVLSVFVADCVPLAFVDPVRKAIGLAHSGWRGTVGRIGAETVRIMRETFGTCPEDLVCAVGPSICQDCYEVSEDVAEAFVKEFAGHEEKILIDKGNGKYQLDLWEANRIVLSEAGVKEENTEVTGICTCCNPERMFSHRASKGRRGNLGAFLALK